MNADSLINVSKPLKDILDSLNIDNNSLRIIIKKSKYELSFWTDTIELKKYPVVFGSNPVDDKLMQGDRCTPEGIFKVK